MSDNELKSNDAGRNLVGPRPTAGERSVEAAPTSAADMLRVAVAARQSPMYGMRSQRSVVRGAAVAAPIGLVMVGLLLAGALLRSGAGLAPSALAAPAHQEVDGGAAIPMLSPLAFSGAASAMAPVGVAGGSPVEPWTAAAGLQQQLVDVAVRDDYFDAKAVTVTVGAVVRWTNRGLHQHSSTSEDGYWGWGLVPGASFSLRFVAPGTYKYYCVYHRAMGMTGTVLVTGSGPLPTPTVGPGPAPGIDGQTIVYDYFADEATRSRTDLFLVQPDGSNVRPLTNTPNLAEAQPSWSPDRRRVAFTASTLGAPGAAWGLRVMDLETGQTRQITGGPEHYEPDWRPDGSLLVFTSIGRSGGVPTSSEIAVITPDGAHYRPLARVLSASYGMVNPTWSPDGQRIAFSLSSNQAGGELYVMNADGSNPHPVFVHPGWDDIDPEWSPDGRYMTFSAGAIGPAAARHDIWLLDLSTGLAGTIAQVPDWDLRRPAWSPEGGDIVFTARFQSDPDRWALYIVPATGGTVRGPVALGVEPDWGSGALLPQVTPSPAPSGTPPEPPTPPTFPTIPPPGTTTPGPPPTFPPPEPTPTSIVPSPTATETNGSATVTATAATAEVTPAPSMTPTFRRGWAYLPISWSP